MHNSDTTTTSGSGSGSGSGAYDIPNHGGMSTSKGNEFTEKHSITAEFPMPPVRCNFGLALNEAHLSYRYVCI
mgnify:CR=1 FL=1